MSGSLLALNTSLILGYRGPKLGVKFSTTIKDISERRKKREAAQIEVEAIQWARDQELLERRAKYEEKRKSVVMERMLAEDERALARRRRRMGRVDPRAASAERDAENESTALFGMDKDLQEAQEQSYDVGLESVVLDWLEATTGHPIDYFYESLRDGVILCHLINEIRPRMIPRIVDTVGSGVPAVGLQARENVKNYLRACEALGVKKTELFVPSDLCDRQNLVAVLNNLTALARVANSSASFAGPRFDLSSNYDEIIANLPLPPEPQAAVEQGRKRPKLMKSFTERFSPSKLESPLGSASDSTVSNPTAIASAPNAELNAPSTADPEAKANSVRSALEEKRKEIERLKEAKRALEEREQRRLETARLRQEQEQEDQQRAERAKQHQIEADERRKKYQESVEKAKAEKAAAHARAEVRNEL